MATFNLIVTGLSTKPLLSAPTETSSSCETVFNMNAFAPLGEEIELTWSVLPGGYTNFTVSVNTGIGYVGISSGYTYIPNGALPIRVTMENNGVLDDALSITMTATNNTTPDTQIRVLNRTSTGGIC